MNVMTKIGSWIAVSLALSFQVCGAAESSIAGAGSSAAAPLYRSWAQAYSKTSGIAVNYDASGSSVGLSKVHERATDFGGSDMPPSETEMLKNGLVAFPVAITGITPVVNLPKIGDGQLRLSGEVLARIFLGDITQWDAQEIARLNPGLSMPKLPIKVVVRSDGSGTTYNFADYLSKVSPAWKTQHANPSSLAWPVGFMAAKGSEGVAAVVKQTAGAISYIDFSYVGDEQLNPVQMKNAEGEFVKPSSMAFRVALSNSEWSSKGVFSSTLTNCPGKGSWPLTMGTFVVLQQVANKPEQTRQVLKFFNWAFSHGDALVAQNNFIHLPDHIQAAAFKVFTSIKDKNGQPVGLTL